MKCELDGKITPFVLKYVTVDTWNFQVLIQGPCCRGDQVGFRSSAQEPFQTSVWKQVTVTRTNIEPSTLLRKGYLRNDPFLR